MIIFLYSSHPDPHSSNLHPQPPLTMSHTGFPLEANLGQFCSLIRDFTCAPSLWSSFSDDPFCYHYLQDQLKVPFFLFSETAFGLEKAFQRPRPKYCAKEMTFYLNWKIGGKKSFLAQDLVTYILMWQARVVLTCLRYNFAAGTEAPCTY